MIAVRHIGNFKNTENFLTKVTKFGYRQILEKYGREGVKALSAATPINSGLTAASWSYEIKEEKNSFSIYWTNSNINKGVPIALIIQYGHGTRNGGYVQGRDYINPAMKPIFDKIAENLWKEITSS